MYSYLLRGGNGRLSMADTIAMLDENFPLRKPLPGISIKTSLGIEEVSPKKNPNSIRVIAYGCLRGLTASETKQLFGWQGKQMCDAGDGHPVRYLEVVGGPYDDPPIANFVVFPGDVNPLIEKAA